MLKMLPEDLINLQRNTEGKGAGNYIDLSIQEFPPRNADDEEEDQQMHVGEEEGSGRGVVRGAVMLHGDSVGNMGSRRVRPRVDEDVSPEIAEEGEQATPPAAGEEGEEVTPPGVEGLGVGAPPGVYAGERNGVVGSHDVSMPHIQNQNGSEIGSLHEERERERVLVLLNEPCKIF